MIITDLGYSYLPEAVYQYSMEEEHYAILLGFDNIYIQQALFIKNEGEAPTPSNS